MNYLFHPENQVRQEIDRAIDHASKPEPNSDRLVRTHSLWVEVKPPQKADQRRNPKRLWDRIDDLEDRLEELERQTKKND